MAWVVTLLSSIQVQDSSANTVLPSFTPGASKLLVVDFAGLADPAAAGISGQADGNGWILVGSFTQAWESAGARVFRRFACKTPAIPAAGTVTLAHAANWHRDAACFTVDETTAGLPATAAACFGIPNGSAQYTDGTSPHALTAALAAFADPANLTLISGTSNTGGGTTFTTKAGYTLLTTVGAVDQQLAVSYIASADTAPLINSSANFAYAAALASEIKMATAVAQAALMPQACY